MERTGSQLEYRHYLSIFSPHLSGDRSRDGVWHRKAERLHALGVNDALVEVMTRAIHVARAYEGSDAGYQLTQGFGRRLKFIWLSTRSLLSVCPPDRTKPMSSDEVETTARDLNVIYINIRGCLDNLAWALPSALAYAGAIKPMAVDIFSSKYLTGIGGDAFNPVVEPYRTWAKEIATRRNPAAHRIPLSVPPSILDRTTSGDFQRAYQRFQEAQATAFAACRQGHYPEAEFAAARAAFEATETIGVFVPVFVHHPEDGHTPIYPTVPADVGQLLGLSTSIIEEMRLLAVA
ncbi:MAG: hypothetical protein Q8R45_03000 [Brevundimonas sp.]|uniref:hypothetical protein n=1 Tax=Brevundimonas sp. TaxID=1871086 RepID=UPI002732E4D4|nr:hypothetical protein [Brevundimonas sp.]MDP3655919.1 hypothetical protein [Brevundimonas sp.]